MSSAPSARFQALTERLELKQVSVRDLDVLQELAISGSCSLTGCLPTNGAMLCA
jgi:hypothetical protein